MGKKVLLKIKGFVGVSLFLMYGLLFAQHVSALTTTECQNRGYHDGQWNSSGYHTGAWDSTDGGYSITHTGNVSIQNVCYQCYIDEDFDSSNGLSPDRASAIMARWLNEVSATDLRSSIYKYGAVIDGSKTSIDLYLRGQALTCNRNADYINNVPTAGDTIGMKFLYESDGDEIPWLTKLGSNVVLDVNRYDETAQDKWTWPGAPIKVTLNVTSFKNDSNVTRTTDADGSAHYKYRVVLYGCPSGQENSQCGYSYTPLEVKVVGAKLTAYARTSDGTLLNGGKSIDEAKVESGTSATVNKTNISGYTFLGWSTSNTGDATKTGDKYTVEKLINDTKVYAVYKKTPVTLTAVAGYYSGQKGCDGTNDDTWYLLANPMKQTTVDYGQNATVGRMDYTGYSFVGWKNTTSVSGCGSKDNSYTKSNLKSNTTVYAIYKKQKRRLTLESVDTDGNSIDSEIKYDEVLYNEKASVTRSVKTGWVFKGFKIASSRSEVPNVSFVTRTGTNNATYVSGSSSPKETYNVKNLTISGVVYAVYARDTKTLTLTAINQNGDSISSTIGDVPSVVNYGEMATARRKSDTAEYKFYCFKETKTGDCIESYDPDDAIYISNPLNTLESINVKDMTQDKTIYAVYTIYTLSVYGKDIYSNASIPDGNTAAYGNDNVSVTRVDLSTRTDLAPEGYKFIGWKNKSSTGRSGLIDDDSISGNSGITITRSLTANDEVYAYYLKKMKLTVDQGEGTRVTVTRGSSNLGLGSTGTIYEDNNMIISNGRLYDGDVINVKIELLPGYTWESHSLVSGSTNETTSTDITNFEVRDNVTITTRAILDRFEGSSSVRSVSSGETQTNGWTNESGTVIQTIDCTVNGCQADFQHALKRTAGAGSVVYKITRTSNYTGKGVNSGTMVESTTLGFDSNNTGIIVRNRGDSRVTLYPGQVVCETLSFKPNVNHEEINIRACASAIGDAQPGDVSLLKIHVRNQNVPKYGEYAKSIYAKPGDTVDYRAEYNPRLQYTYSLKPQAMQINNRSVYTNALNMTSELFFNSLASSNGVRNWNNDFSTVVYGRAVTATSGGSTLTSTNYNFLNGLVSEQIKNKTYKIPSNQAGKAVDGVAVTNYATSTQTTPSQVTFYQSGDKNVAKVITTAASDTARVIVPYNFILRAQIANEVSEVAYAGETFSIKINAIVKKKTNSETTEGSEATAYATKADSTKRRVIYYVLDDGAGVVSGADEWGNVDSDICTYFGRTRNNNCNYANSSDGIGLNASGSLSGETKQFTMNAVNVPDLDAGTQVCAAVALYPATSGADTSTDVNGNGKWTVSDSKCFKIAKRPSFQVWGGNLYSLGNANIPVSTKNNLKGIYDYSYNGDKSNTVIFGSWVEHDVTAGGLVSGLASGAATGKITLPGKDLQVEGSFEGSSVSYCENRVPLSLANFTTSTSLTICRNNATNGVTGSSGVTSTLTNKSTLISYLLNKANEYTTYNNGETVDLSNNYDEISSDNGKSTRLTNGSGALVVTSSSVIGDGVTHLVKAGGDVTINSDIIYNNGPITSLAQVPKLLIYAKNIIVGCDVNRVDAILIAENNVNTCKSGEGESINDQKNSRQLKVNGIIITDTMDLNRTYGATAGEGSGVPAEIINYDTSTVLWGRDMAAGDSYNGLNSVYQHELAPRY